MLGINELNASDFLKEVFITLEDKIYFLLQEFGQKNYLNGIDLLLKNIQEPGSMTSIHLNMMKLERDG